MVNFEALGEWLAKYLNYKDLKNVNIEQRSFNVTEVTFTFTISGKSTTTVRMKVTNHQIETEDHRLPLGLVYQWLFEHGYRWTPKGLTTPKPFTEISNADLRLTGSKFGWGDLKTIEEGDGLKKYIFSGHTLIVSKSSLHLETQEVRDHLMLLGYGG